MAAVDGAEVAKHNSRKSCWIVRALFHRRAACIDEYPTLQVLDSNVYDVTSFVSKHPGGAAIILNQAGTV
jgi:L-lactate dehydrogenase (cytochrome)